MDFTEQLNSVLKQKNPLVDLDPETLIKHAIDNKEAVVAANNALSTVTPPESTGRSPKDTYIVKRPENESKIDWSSSYNQALDPETFDMLLDDALETLKTKDKIYVKNRYLGADPEFSLKVRCIMPRALHALFIDNMFRPMPEGAENSIFAGKDFTLITLPYDKLDSSKYEGRLRKRDDGTTSNMAVVMDPEKRVCLVYGSAYCGSMKKSMYTMMNYYLPELGVLPLHCSANEGKDEDVALLLGLSGTGKTTLSADKSRALYGDDEHGWSKNGVFNFENGCYAKLINLNPEKEPEIFAALKHGAIIENAKLLDDGKFDYDDDSITPNSRASYPLSHLENIKQSSMGLHPKTILFLTADANGVLPPIAKLTKEQAMFQFIMGYTSKLAGTETGIIDPVSTFSRFFGAPFMPLNPDVYAKMLGEFMEKYDTKVYMINTGWTAGPFGKGHRIDLKLTRAMVNAALNDEFTCDFVEDKRFNMQIPTQCTDVPSEILDPKSTWEDKDAYEARADKLAEDFKIAFEKNFMGKVSEEICAACPKPTSH